VGSIAASGLVLALLPGPLGVKCVFHLFIYPITQGHEPIFASARSTTRASGVNLAQGVFIEAFITSALVLAVLMLAAEKHAATPFAPVRLSPSQSRLVP
jgi:aquaporin rerated protein, other eukaryote